MIQKRDYFILCCLLGLGILFSCREIEVAIPPKISMDTTRFVTKPLREVHITPTVEYADEKTVYSWTINGKIIGIEKDITFSSAEVGNHYLKFKVTNAFGTATLEVKVEVNDLVPPGISFPDLEETTLLEREEEILLKPSFANKEGLQLEWIIDGEVVSTDKEFLFQSPTMGTFLIRLRAINEDGDDEYILKIKVMEEVPLVVSFPYPEQSVTIGRTIRVLPRLASKKGVSFQWFVNGVEDTQQTGDEYLYTASALGKEDIKVVITKGKKKGEASLTVNTVKANQFYRPAKSGSSPYSTKVYEFLPAPGQFVNEHYTAYTMEEACRYAEGRLKETQYVSLGGFGGYIVVGFDHSIPNRSRHHADTTQKEAYDFAIMGNSFDGSSEPGIVWVMQDENGDGLPNDTWYELRGSETGKPETIQDYEVTYFRATSPKSHTTWVDNQGNKGEIDWLGFHQQDNYYPLWVQESALTLRGTCLKSRTYDQSGNGTYWVNPDFGWGYADNFSPVDRLTKDINYNAAPNANHFRICHAMTHDQQPIELEYIDFIKVQTGLNTKAGWLGENSTEVFKFIDIQIK